MFTLPETYDVLIVGSGHAGIEAALASARLGCSTLLLTQNLDTIGQMSCNPAIGGLSKGHIVREIDALGGFMGENTDATGIQFRLLNRTKGASVRAPRAQCGKKAYQFRAKAELERTANLHVKQATVQRVLTDGGSAVGVETDLGIAIRAHTVIVTSGTFLRALLHIGRQSKAGGRMADASSNLSDSLRELGFTVRRFKTGTPCRINRSSIDFDQCEIQEGDDPPPRFGFVQETLRASANDFFTLNSRSFHVEQVPCWITKTTAATAQIIRENLHKSPLYSGQIQGTGPRYCPSIEDKVVKFADKAAHQVFLEPEGLQTGEFYINGISTSLPYDVQLKFVRTIPGLERAEIMRPGYAVEYDYFPPVQLQHTLETKLVKSLFFAGQVNGTSGYEEAAGQGLIAGANAALKIMNRAPLILSRRDAYIGVLIDDLVTKGTDEPYRMFTSRAEDRLSLRQDNADQRLTGIGRIAGLVPDERWQTFTDKICVLEKLRSISESTLIHGRRIKELLKRPEFTPADIPTEIRSIAPDELWELIEADFKLEGYVRRQAAENRQIDKRDRQVIPDGLDYGLIPSLRLETRQKLRELRPCSLGQAAKVSGITHADISIISIWLRKNVSSMNTRVPTASFRDV